MTIEKSVTYMTNHVLFPLKDKGPLKNAKI